MWGAIIGDLAGSIYEYNQTKGIKPVKINNIIEDNSFYSDDTILTIAIADAILKGGNYDIYLRGYINKYNNYKPDFSPYFNTSFSPQMIKWAKSTSGGQSIGNGAMMRISSVGYLFNSLEDIVENAMLATIPSHNSSEAIKSATVLALMIFYFRNGLSKEQVYEKLNIDIQFKPFERFNTTCFETLENCLYVLYNSNSFEDAIRKVVMIGGDTDTNAAIVGSVAEAIYGIDENLKEKAKEKLPKEFVKVLTQADKRRKC